MRPWQIRLSTCGRSVMFPSEELRRRAVLALARVGGESLLCYSTPDDHGHLIALLEDERARMLARSIRLAWMPLAAEELDPPWVRPIRSRAHLVRAFEYQLQQNLHHELEGHPATWSGSCFVDLVGARTVPGLRPREVLREALPRYRVGDTYEAVGLLREPLQPADDAAIRAAGLVRLVDAASAACCAPPALADRSAMVVRARAAIAGLSVDAGFSTRGVADQLNISMPTARRLRAARPDPQAEATTRMRLALEDAIVRAAIDRRASRPA
jgi:hypothetical protein